MANPKRIIFMGTPEFAVPTLAALADSRHEVVLVVTQPDKPKGRGRKTAPPPVKIMAENKDLYIYQPTSLKDPEVLDLLKSYTPDFLVVVAYGKLLPTELLDLAAPGPVNLHPSMLPAYRGPSPIQSALLAGDTVTGVSTMILDEGQDTGPVLLRREVAIMENETAGQLHDRLAVIGAELILESIEGLIDGTVKPTPQEDDRAVECCLLTKEDGLIDWTKAAADISCQVRGLDPWPGAYTFFEGKRLKIFGSRISPGKGNPGQVLALDNGEIHIATGDGSLRIAEFQIEGKKTTNRRTILERPTPFPSLHPR